MICDCYDEEIYLSRIKGGSESPHTGSHFPIFFPDLACLLFTKQNGFEVL